LLGVDKLLGASTAGASAILMDYCLDRRAHAKTILDGWASVSVEDDDRDE
jgi:hypothetical protein